MISGTWLFEYDIHHIRFVLTSMRVFYNMLVRVVQPIYTFLYTVESTKRKKNIYEHILFYSFFFFYLYEHSVIYNAQVITLWINIIVYSNYWIHGLHILCLLEGKKMALRSTGWTTLYYVIGVFEFFFFFWFLGHFFLFWKHFYILIILGYLPPKL